MERHKRFIKCVREKRRPAVQRGAGLHTETFDQSRGIESVRAARRMVTSPLP